MSRPNPPILLSPNGGDQFTDQVTIMWASPTFLDSDQRPVSFAVYFTDQYDPSNDPNWLELAILPSSVSQFVWQPRMGISSTLCRVALRSINSRGERSEYVVSAGNFSISRQRLEAPSIIVPVNGKQYDRYINIQTDDSDIINTYSQRTYYQFFYSCNSLNIPRTAIAQDVPIGSGPVFWNIINLEAAPDYVVECFLEDNSGNTSDHTFVSIAIVHQGYFILDTTPPVAAITINNNATFTNNTQVSVQIASYDEATAVQSMQLLDNAGTIGQPDVIGSVRSFQFTSGDGVKALQLLLQDFGGNRNNQTLQRLFQVLIEDTGGAFVDIALDTSADVLWAITAGTSNQLYKVAIFPSLVTSFALSPTAVGIFNGVPFVGLANADNTGTLIKYTSLQETVQSFTDTDSIINTITQFGQLLYIGMENGEIYTFDGLNLSLLQTLLNPVELLVSDGNLLYAALKNDPNVYIFNGTSFIST